MVLQDCFLRYRESAEFIIVSDFDEIFVPLIGASLKDEFSFWKNLKPMASAFLYPRSPASAITGSSIQTFNFFDTLYSIRVDTTALKLPTKAVYNSQYAETVWIHWPGIAKTNAYVIPDGEGLCLHLKYHYTDGKQASVPTGDLLPDHVKKTLLRRGPIVNYTRAAFNVPNLPSAPFQYAGIIYNSFLNFAKLLEGQYYPVGICPTPTVCDFPTINMTCTIAVRSYRTQCVPEKNMCFSIPINPSASMITKQNGCALDNFMV
uniref:Glycosyltransferase family 92 protein n=1 Tax=Panagrellus redivivus TaxID=6233 RepID=A0A7E4UQK7_PANRE